MNEDTLVVVHCYAGDGHLVEAFLPQYLHHEVPVLILSPSDAPVVIDHPGVECRSAGKAAYFGQDSLDRQREHLKILATYPQRFFLLNDADSFCLSPEIPAYLYEGSEGTIWSNEVGETRPHTSPYPKIAFHPPYFLTRSSIERLLTVDVPAHEITPFIDWYMMALAHECGLKHRSFPDGQSFPAWRHAGIPETKELGHNYVHEEVRHGIDGARKMAEYVRRGTVIVHSVKHVRVRDELVKAHRLYMARHGNERRRRSVRPRPEASGEALSVLVALRDDTPDQYRTALWGVVRGLLERYMPRAEVIVASDDGEDPFCKTQAINRAAAQATRDVFYILDADSWVDPANVDQACRALGRVAWAKPWVLKLKLGPQATAEVLAGGWDGVFRTEWTPELEFKGPYQPAPPLLVTRRAFEDVGGLDPRIRGWGSEDAAFAMALTTLHGPPKTIRGECVHLHHPRIGRSGADFWNGQDGYRNTVPLLREYRAARRNPVAMRQLIERRA